MNQFVAPVLTPVSATLPAQVRKDVANIFFILDKSGSMHSMKEQAITGFNEYVKSQRELGGVTRITLVQFNHMRDVIYEARDVAAVPALDYDTYVPSGNTALNDSVGFVLSENLATCSPNETNIMAILTDGAENASKEYTQAAVKALIAQAEAKGWEILFLGANMSKAQVVSSYGISASNVSTFDATAKGARDAFTTLSATSSSYRSMRSMGVMDKVDVEAVYNATSNLDKK
jgi:hypothetical protein